MPHCRDRDRPRQVDLRGGLMAKDALMAERPRAVELLAEPLLRTRR
jgi:hypothetical protein